MAHPTGGYKNKKGKRIPGVTTIIGRFKDSGGLLYWAFEQGKSAERGEISKLYDKRDEAAEAGTICHELVEMHIELNEDIPQTVYQVFKRYDVDKEIAKQAWQGFQNYLKWEATTEMKIVEQESQLVSEKYQFGGSPDAIMVKDELALGDWKTSNGIYQDYLIQLAAYKHLWEENHPNKPITGGFHLCRFSKEHADFHHHYWSELDDAWEQFKLFRKAYDLDKKLKKRL